MSPSPDPPFESQPQGISLDELAEAFAQVMGVEPRRPVESADADAGGELGELGDSQTPGSESSDAGEMAQSVGEPVEQEDSCPLSPRTILEAMLFVGNRENQPLTPARAAELMRDVAIDEIPALIEELNRSYAAASAPYEIIGEGAGYRMTLRREYHSLGSRFYGKVREARLSQAAVDVLALVAYQQPVTGEKINHLRGKPSNHLLTHLVRRGLLRIERPDPKRRTPHYRTTDRFLLLFNLQTLDDLPRSEDAGPP